MGLNALHSLSALTLVCICIFPAWSMRACGIILRSSGFLGDKILTLSLTVSDVWIGKLCELYFFMRYFFIGGVVCGWK